MRKEEIICDKCGLTCLSTFLDDKWTHKNKDGKEIIFCSLGKYDICEPCVDEVRAKYKMLTKDLDELEKRLFRSMASHDRHKT